MFRKRVDKIRGVAGSLDGTVALIVDAAASAGPGILKVLTEAGAAAHVAAEDSAMLDVEVGRLAAPPVPITTIAGAPTLVLDSLANPPDAVVINPPISDGIGPVQPFIALARRTAILMRDQGKTGSIVIISGIGRSGTAGSIAEFLRHETEDLAAEFAPNGIRANAVAPGPLGSNRRGQPLSSRVTPLGHSTVHPVEVGKAVWFLVNEELSAGITGSTMRVDRGASLLRPDW